MPYRKRQRCEQLEVYLVHLFLAYRRLIFIVGMLILVYAIGFIFIRPLIGFASLLPAIFMLLLGNSYNVILYTARLGAWIGTRGQSED